MLLIIRLPHETFNAAVRDGSAGTKMEAILDEVKPESVHFTEIDGRRAVVMIVEMEKPSRVPVLAEPWFLTFDADVEFHIVMEPEELRESGLERLGRKWGDGGSTP